MKNFMEQNLETVDKHKMTIDELLFLPKSTGRIYRKQKLLVMVMMQSLLTMFLKNR